MGGLFGGDMEMIQRLLQGLGVGLAEAAGPPGGAWANTGGITPEQLLASQAATNPLPPIGATPEVNPSPVPPGVVPLPRPFPGNPATGEVPPGSVTDATRSAGVLPGGVPDIVAPGDVGAALVGAQGPTSLGGAQRPTPLQATSPLTDIGGRAKMQDEKIRGGLADALKGVAAPKAPELQRISSPNAPRPTGTIRGGDLQALLLALNAGAPALERKLPMTLGRG